MKGDVCVLPKKKSEDKERRKREVRTTKNTLVILGSFMACRLLIFGAIVFRQVINHNNDFFETNHSSKFILIFIITITTTSKCKHSKQVAVDNN